ncbi:Zn-ribbon domain-containing OB-fold protein [Halorubrum trueperi]|uniref:Zn-ribbon domain-containing OB-fold protein n=1 Tax=Halorubrum trueperi TaxID=2004704 RepID=A0ABD5UGE9_9EURY
MSEELPSEDAVRTLDDVDYEEWREQLEAGVLLGLECRSCGHVTATPKRVCINCGARELDAVELPTRGTVYSETTIEVTPEGFDGPYQVVMVELGSVHLLVRVDGTVEIGDVAEFTGTVVTEDLPAPVFEPVE